MASIVVCVSKEAVVVLADLAITDSVGKYGSSVSLWDYLTYLPAEGMVVVLGSTRRDEVGVGQNIVDVNVEGQFTILSVAAYEENIIVLYREMELVYTNQEYC